MTSTPPLQLAAWDHAACSWLVGPGQVIGWVGSVWAIPGGCGDPGGLAVSGEVGEKVEASSGSSLQDAMSAVAAAVVSPSKPSLLIASRRVSRPST
jgi:hypothetical protein